VDARKNWPSLLTSLLGGASLTADDTAWAMNEIMTGQASSIQVAAFLIALRAKGETIAEVSGLADAMLAHATPISVAGDLVDIVGTGGDRAHTVNISTMGAIAAAAAGARVVKHGNRAATSKCGAADLLERLGVVIDLPPESTARVADELGVTFCFAPLFHPGFRYAAEARGALGVPTVFNFLGPLTNPARPHAAAVGVADRRMCPIVAGVFAARGMSALVFRGDDGLDELTTTSTSSVWMVRDGAVTEATFDPADLGLARATAEQLRGADAAYNAEVARDFLAGTPGPVREAVLLNAAAALVAASGTVPPTEASLTAALHAAYDRAAAAIDTGAATTLLTHWTNLSQSLRP
jgi:anthranilate phosphoribosyltransferase